MRGLRHLRSAIPLLAFLSACGSQSSPIGAVRDTGENSSRDSGVDGGAPCDKDGDGFDGKACGGEDCDDSSASNYPGAVDTCDGDDNDCDGEIDENDACDCAEPPPAPTLPFSERVCIKGGWFLMGVADDDPFAEEFGPIEKPQHRVFVSPFYLDVYEFTNRRFIECWEQEECELPVEFFFEDPYDIEEHSTEDRIDAPMTFVNRGIAENACRWSGGRLPTEAEWERTAVGLGDDPRPYVHGDEPSTCEQENLWECYGYNLEDPTLTQRQLSPPPRQVGMGRPNAEGVFDVGGNIAEVVLDEFDRLAYDRGDGARNPCIGCPRQPARNDSTVSRGANNRVAMSELSQRNQLRLWSTLDVAVFEFAGIGFRCAYPAQARQ